MIEEEETIFFHGLAQPKTLKKEVAVEMKVTWKNNKKKRCLPTLSHFTDLPFEHNDQPHSEDGARVPDPDQSHAVQLANEFQAQGDKLAVVCFFVTHTHVVVLGSVVHLLFILYKRKVD